MTSAPEESLGAKAGLRVHDVVVQFGDQKLGAVEKLKEWLGAADGKVVTLKVLRGGPARRGAGHAQEAGVFQSQGAHVD